MACCTESWDCIATVLGCPCGWLLAFCPNLKAGLWECIPPEPPRTWGGCPTPRRCLAPPGSVGCDCWPGTPLGGTWRMPLARDTLPPPGIPCMPEGRTCCCWGCMGRQQGRTCCISGEKNGRCPACKRTSEYKMFVMQSLFKTHRTIWPPRAKSLIKPSTFTSDSKIFNSGGTQVERSYFTCLHNGEQGIKSKPIKGS